ncbi:hypothetical protein LXA43DRAFT_1089268 [Ganoderma leucocontextum]|nr:hypothetical protein LXA43DRAFT_1089268 [Ganoderma leucocontextum]
MAAHRDGFHSSTTHSCPAPWACDYMCRLLIGFGRVPGATALYFHLAISETPRFTMDVEDFLTTAPPLLEIRLAFFMLAGAGVLSTLLIKQTTD